MITERINMRPLNVYNFDQKNIKNILNFYTLKKFSHTFFSTIQVTQIMKKIFIYASMILVLAQNTIIDNNNVNGPRNNIYFGQQNNINGKDNDVAGYNNHIEGDVNKVYGNVNELKGHSNLVQGQGNHVDGLGNVIQGQGNIILGQNASQEDKQKLKQRLFDMFQARGIGGLAQKTENSGAQNGKSENSVPNQNNASITEKKNENKGQIQSNSDNKNKETAQKTEIKTQYAQVGHQQNGSFDYNLADNQANLDLSDISMNNENTQSNNKHQSQVKSQKTSETTNQIHYPENPTQDTKSSNSVKTVPREEQTYDQSHQQNEPSVQSYEAISTKESTSNSTSTVQIQTIHQQTQNIYYTSGSSQQDNYYYLNTQPQPQQHNQNQQSINSVFIPFQPEQEPTQSSSNLRRQEQNQNTNNKNNNNGPIVMDQTKRQRRYRRGDKNYRPSDGTVTQSQNQNSYKTANDYAKAYISSGNQHDYVLISNNGAVTTSNAHYQQARTVPITYFANEAR